MAGTYQTDIASQIRELVPVRAAAEYYGFTPNRAGYIRCPFHAEKTASLKLFDNGFCCFGCGAKGSVIDFTMRLFDIGFVQAMLRLDMDFSLGLTNARPNRTAQSKILEERRRRQKRRLELEAEIRRLSHLHYRFHQDSRIYEPVGTDFHPRYVEAVKRLPEVQYRLEELENELERVNRGEG